MTKMHNKVIKSYSKMKIENIKMKTDSKYQ